ncbi:MAG: recombinase RecA [Candidatus Caenarcaniphilales bacterium]|nr:recombinase RecA [Candidatus Caenarcaniphilales bacterium]
MAKFAAKGKKASEASETKKSVNSVTSFKSSTDSSIDPEKLKTLGLTLDQIEKDFGKGSIMRLGAAPKTKIESIATGSLNLDLALGVGGIPKGRIIEIYGPESSGKTTLAMHICAEFQRKGGIAAFIDAEHAMDPDYSKKVGVNIDELLISQPDTGEQALEIVDQLVRSGAVDVIVIDSVAALVPRAEIEGDMGDSLPGLQARLMSQALRKIAGITSRTGTTIVFINQLRQKIGITYGSNETTTGGNALKFYASVRLDIRKIETLKKGEVEYGNRVRVKVVKNKVAPPFRKAEFEIIYGQGISQEGELVDMGVQIGNLKKLGTWYSWIDLQTGEETKIGQGRDSALQYIRENPTLAAGLREKIQQSFSPLRLDEEELKEADKENDLTAEELEVINS